ncbi:hypothetical protein EVAR_83016_1 [Eumeta japonica]|uniref:Uncharacterized protein n=1 Tax=Eumeta variegata TaxID=151549 RepID=A0A4C2A6K7_EUMVA|nr:hypothetical protein EVAR_83016_1 [Eumeta japonica]
MIADVGDDDAPKSAKSSRTTRGSLSRSAPHEIAALVDRERRHVLAETYYLTNRDPKASSRLATSPRAAASDDSRILLVRLVPDLTAKCGRNSRALALYFPTYARTRFLLIFDLRRVRRGERVAVHLVLYSSTVSGSIVIVRESRVIFLQRTVSHLFYTARRVIRDTTRSFHFGVFALSLPNDSISKCSLTLTLSPRDNVSFRRSLSSYPYRAPPARPVKDATGSPDFPRRTSLPVMSSQLSWPMSSAAGVTEAPLRWHSVSLTADSFGAPPAGRVAADARMEAYGGRGYTAQPFARQYARGRHAAYARTLALPSLRFACSLWASRRRGARSAISGALALNCSAAVAGRRRRLTRLPSPEGRLAAGRPNFFSSAAMMSGLSLQLLTGDAFSAAVPPFPAASRRSRFKFSPRLYSCRRGQLLFIYQLLFLSLLYVHVSPLGGCTRSGVVLAASSATPSAEASATRQVPFGGQHVLRLRHIRWLLLFLPNSWPAFLNQLAPYFCVLFLYRSELLRGLIFHTEACGGSAGRLSATIRTRHDTARAGGRAMSLALFTSTVIDRCSATHRYERGGRVGIHCTATVEEMRARRTT